MENELIFTREQIIELREKFWKQSQIEWLNELWSMAYQKLASDLDYLDAMMARTEGKTKEI